MVIIVINLIKESLRKNNLLTCLGLRAERCAVTTSPATLNTLSERIDVTGTDKCFLATGDILGKNTELTTQHSSGQLFRLGISVFWDRTTSSCPKSTTSVLLLAMQQNHSTLKVKVISW